MEEEDFIGKYSVRMIDIIIIDDFNRRVIIISRAFSVVAISKVDQFSCCTDAVPVISFPWSI